MAHPAFLPSTNPYTTKAIATLIVKGAFTAYCVNNIFSDRIKAICSGAAYIALALLSKQLSAGSWIPLSKRDVQLCYNRLDEEVKNVFIWWYMCAIIMRVATTILVKDFTPESSKIFYQAKAESKLATLYILFDHCIRAPVIEEVIFRGGVQEKIRDIQVCYFGEKADNALNKIGRIIFQASLFGLGHYGSNQNKGTNVSHVAQTFNIGLLLGYYKEKTGTLWLGIIHHFLENVLVSLKYLITKR